MSQNRRSVLVADDDPTVALLMPVALAAHDFSVTVVDNGVAALAAFRQGHFDIVLLDVEMPEMDGFEACAAIRANETEDTLVVLVSGHCEAVFVERAAALGAEYISKPVDWSMLGTRLRDLLNARGGQPSC